MTQLSPLFRDRSLKALRLCLLACVGSAPVTSLQAQSTLFTSVWGQNGTTCGATTFSPDPIAFEVNTCSEPYSTSLFRNVASYATLGAYSDVSVITDGTPSRIIADAIVESRVMLVVGGGSGSGSLSFSVDVSGSSGPSDNDACFVACNLGSVLVDGPTGVSFSKNFRGGGVLSGVIPFEFGVPFAFRMYLEAITMVAAGSPAGSFAFSDFSHTADLGAFRVTDATGAGVAATVVADDGHVYAVDYASTVAPEPSSISLLAIGLLLIVFVRERRRLPGSGKRLASDTLRLAQAP